MNRRWMLLGLAGVLAGCATAKPAEHATHDEHPGHDMAGMQHDMAAMDDAAPRLPEGLKGPVLRFEEAEVAFYVENDGTHLVALNRDGQRMWRREPFVEFPIAGERASAIRELKISGYDAKTGHRVLIARNATSFRGLDMINGDYVMG